MRYVNLPGTDIRASSLGFGCASLGSRVSKRDGLAALSRGFEAGVTWYDLAPIYGGGLAESIFSDFLKGKRDKVQVCTKVGIGRPRYDPLLRIAGAVIRPMVNRFGALHQGLRKVSKRQNFSVPLTPDLIEKSIAKSLKRMRTDYIDVFALHDPSPEDVMRDEVVYALQSVIDRGQARYISVAGDADAIRAAVRGNGPYQFLQFADSPDASIIEEVQSCLIKPKAFVTHSILGIGGAKDSIIRRLQSDDALLERLRKAGYQGAVQDVAVNLLMDRALASNPEGVVLSSMFSGRHLESNVSRVEYSALDDVKAFLSELFSLPPSHTLSVA